MKLYIDIEHFEALASQLGHPQFKQCLQMLQQDCDIRLTFPKCELRPNSTRKKQVQDKINILFTELQRNRGNSQSVEENFLIPTLSESEKAYEHLTSLYFVDSPDVKKGLINPQIGDEIKALTSLYVDNRYIPSKQYNIRQMRDWSTIENETCICTDIILTDLYLFAQSDIHYQINAYDLINSLCKKSIGVKVNIVLFTLVTYKDGGVDRHLPIDTILRNIKDLVSAITGEEPYITIVNLSLREEHDRQIFTNYKAISSGDSFTYFEEKNGTIALVSKGRDLYANSHLDRGNLENSQNLIQDLQTYINNHSSGIYSIFGDKKSNFLQFP